MESDSKHKKIGNIDCYIVSAGDFLVDGGAAMGVLPKTIWQRFLKVDEKNRITLALNLLLIRADGKNILVDTGIGNKISDKIRKIYHPSAFLLPENLRKIGLQTTDIDIVVLTHLHFDHCGGTTSILNGQKVLTFPNALHIIQQKEWKIAKNPDELDKASYNFAEDLALLEESGNYKLIAGDFALTPEIRLELTGGHSEGMQVIRIDYGDELAYYAGDIIPMDANRHLSVTSAFDLNRKQTFLAKKKILRELQARKGILFLNHEPAIETIDFNSR